VDAMELKHIGPAEYRLQEDRSIFVRVPVELTDPAGERLVLRWHDSRVSLDGTFEGMKTQMTATAENQGKLAIDTTIPSKFLTSPSRLVFELQQLDPTERVLWLADCWPSLADDKPHLQFTVKKGPKGPDDW
jgi:hypothetical protein